MLVRAHIARCAPTFFWAILMANGRRLPALREFRQYLDNEIYQINKQLEAEGGNGASGTWLAEQRRSKQALFEEIDYVIEQYGDSGTHNAGEHEVSRRDLLFLVAFVAVTFASLMMSLAALMQ